MMRLKLHYLSITILSIFFLQCDGYIRSSTNVNCDLELIEIQKSIKEDFNADSVTIFYRVLKEEIYFPTMKSIVVTIENATTRTLDFKELPSSHYQRDEFFLETNDSLEKEGIPVAQLIIDNCETSHINDISINFVKRSANGGRMYSYISHYPDLLATAN